MCMYGGGGGEGGSVHTLKIFNIYSEVQLSVVLLVTEKHIIIVTAELACNILIAVYSRPDIPQ